MPRDVPLPVRLQGMSDRSVGPIKGIGIGEAGPSKRVSQRRRGSGGPLGGSSSWLAPYRMEPGAWARSFTLLTCLANLPVPLLVQELIDRVVTQGRVGPPAVVRDGAPGGVRGSQAAVSLANGLVIGGIGQGVVRDLRHGLYDRLQRLSLAFYDKTPSGAILSRLMDDVGAIQTFVTGQTFTILTDLGTTLVITSLLLARNWRLAIVVLAFAPLYAVNFRYFMRKIRDANTLIREKMDLIFGDLKAKIDGTLVIKAQAREPEEIVDFAAKLDDAHVPRVRESELGAAFGNISAAISGVGTASVFAVGALEVLAGRMTPGGVVSTAALAGLIFGPIARLADLAYVFEQASASVDRLGEVLDLEPTSGSPGRKRQEERGHSTFRRSRASMPQQPPRKVECPLFLHTFPP